MFEVHYDQSGVHLKLRAARLGLLSRVFGRTAPTPDLDDLSASDHDLVIALADVRALADEYPDAVTFASDGIKLSHKTAASLEAGTATKLGLPPLVDLSFRTDVDGVVGSPTFKLRYEWSKNGQRQSPRRVGAILETAAGPRRVPIWMLEAIEVADAYMSDGSDASQWTALARFRQALDPGVTVGSESTAARVSMTDFLAGLEVKVADRFSIHPNAELDDFDVVPFDGRCMERDDPDGFSEAAGELAGSDLGTFQARVRERGALPAYRLGRGRYLVVDRSAVPALQVMATMQRAPGEERAAFIRNPRPHITEAVVASLKASGALDGLSPVAEEELIERAAGPLFVETREYSARVIGLRVYEKSIETAEASGTTWLPEAFAKALAERLSSLPALELWDIHDRVVTAIDAEEPTVDVAGYELPARTETLDLVATHLERAEAADEDPEQLGAEVPAGPIVLDTIVNFEELKWEAGVKPRTPVIDRALPSTVRTPLKEHQVGSFEWQVAAWCAGLPGILNADEQGLGKTLQTITFLVWLKAHLARAEGAGRGPVLVVAPTSLLENWESEVRRHTDEPGLGHLIRLYGSATASRRISGSTGKDIDSGDSKLDFGALHEALEEGRGHRYWILTTYTTLTNYQHSLARLPFSAAVFDEIQALKNPDSLRAHAARSVNADFRIGLTGTPIENSVVDLWAVMDQLAPGSLDSLKAFRQRYSVPDESNMAELHARVFQPSGRRPALALRRIKDEVARDLPAKSRRLHPRLMPDVQAREYDEARLKLAVGGLGAALKALHHIRAVSVHPSLDAAGSDAEFIGASGRLDATFAILKDIAARGEKALVFIEHRQMQYRFMALAKAAFRLPRVDLINGETPIQKRQAIVDRFQSGHGVPGFDLLVLGPKAAGTGLTLTAATHVIHLSRWWNPAVEEQCNDRVHRIGQARPVTIHVPMAIHPGYRENSFDCLLHSLMQRKRRLAASALWPMGDTEADVGELQRMLASEFTGEDGDPLRSAVTAMFLRDQLPPPRTEPDGSVIVR